MPDSFMSWLQGKDDDSGIIENKSVRMKQAVQGDVDINTVAHPYTYFKLNCGEPEVCLSCENNKFYDSRSKEFYCPNCEQQS